MCRFVVSLVHLNILLSSFNFDSSIHNLITLHISRYKSSIKKKNCKQIKAKTATSTENRVITYAKSPTTFLGFDLDTVVSSNSHSNGMFFPQEKQLVPWYTKADITFDTWLQVQLSPRETWPLFHHVFPERKQKKKRIPQIIIIKRMHITLLTSNIHQSQQGKKDFPHISQVKRS